MESKLWRTAVLYSDRKKKYLANNNVDGGHNANVSNVDVGAERSGTSRQPGRHSQVVKPAREFC